MDETPKRRPSIRELSKTPSWVMLGVIVGALFVWALPRREPEARPIIINRVPESKSRPAEPPLLTTIEAVFEAWSEYAVWDNDTTQVALWNASVGDFAECYEVRRINGVYYFRSLPQLAHPVIRHGRQPPPECPLRFTETEEQYREWREQGRFERPPEPTRPALAMPPTRVELTPSASTDVKPIAPSAESSIDVRGGLGDAVGGRPTATTSTDRPPKK